MNAPYNINEQFDSIIKKIEMDMEFTDTGKVLYTSDQVATKAYDLIFATDYFTEAFCQWNYSLLAIKMWVELKTYFAEEHRALQDTQPTSAGATYPSANALVEANTRGSENINTIDLLVLNTDRDRDTYAKLFGRVTSLMVEILITKKNLAEALKENTCLERVLGQRHKITRRCGGAAGRGGTFQKKKGAHY